ncbi:hypothetical protein Tco_0928533 [Tanacetum coccineum]
MYCDNTGAITIANKSGITKGARHYRAKVHYLCGVIEFGDVKIEKVHTNDNLANPFTKALAFPKHSEHTKNIGLLPAICYYNSQVGAVGIFVVCRRLPPSSLPISRRNDRLPPPPRADDEFDFPAFLR